MMIIAMALMIMNCSNDADNLNHYFGDGICDNHDEVKKLQTHHVHYLLKGEPKLQYNCLRLVWHLFVWNILFGFISLT